MPNDNDIDTPEELRFETIKLIVEGMKYIADATFKFLLLALPILYMQWSNGDRLVDQGKKLDKVAVKADAAVEKAETAAKKSEESVRAIRETRDP